MIKNNIFVNKEVILMTSSKKDNFMDKFTNYFNNVYHHNDIQRMVYNHINLKELEEKIARKKKELDNPKKKNWKRQDDNNIYKEFLESKNVVPNKKEKNKNKWVSSSNENIKNNYNNNKRSVLYKKN
tara:strand:+ start:7268 stop:7648 length:381 start_codon:yes stop_codon:yes gene_type:complete